MATFSDFPMEREKVLTSGNTQVGVMPELSLVSHFQVGNWAVLYRASETGNVKRWGIPLMIPNFGRLKQGIFQEKGTSLPMHGFGRNLPWKTIAQDTTSITFQLSSNEQTRPAYPYEFVFTVTVEVSEGTLTYTLTMENRGDESMAVAPGLHPYFTIAQQDKTRITVQGLEDFNAQEINWDSQPPDKHVSFPHSVTISFPGRGTLTIAEQPVNGKYSLADMQIWSEPASAPDHNFICFEPIVTYEDGLNRPAERLNIAPHSSQQIVIRFHAQPL